MELSLAEYLIILNILKKDYQKHLEEIENDTLSPDKHEEHVLICYLEKALISKFEENITTEEGEENEKYY